MSIKDDANNPAKWPPEGGLHPPYHSRPWAADSEAIHAPLHDTTAGTEDVGREQRSDKFVRNEFGRPQAGPER